MIQKITAASLFLALSGVSAVAQAPAPAPPPAATPQTQTSRQDTYVGQQTGELRSSKLIGLNVYNAANGRVGDVNDLIISKDGKVHHAVVGVGGFLGINEKNVAIPFNELTFKTESDGSMRAVVQTTKEALEKAPNYKFIR